jgi:hypothetical protein
MGYPNNMCMHITIYVHHMQIDELFDFLNDRIDTPPPYWYHHEDAPYSISGGYAAVNVDYHNYQKIRTERTWDSPLNI